jgi:hypothetical protein
MSEMIVSTGFDAGALAKLTEWTTKRDELLAKAGQITEVNDAAALELAGGLQAAMSKHRKALETERMALTRKIDAVKKEIMAQEATMAGALDMEVQRLKEMNNDYATAQMLAARRAEEERLAKERAAAEAAFAAEQKAAEEARQAEIRAEKARAMFGAAAPVAAPVVAPVPEPVAAPVMPIQTVAAPRASANSIRTVTRFEVTDKAQVPSEFLMVNEAAIRQFIEFKKKCGTKPTDLVIAGVRIWEEADVRAK